MKARIFIVSFLAVVLFCFVFSSSIADDYDLMYYWNSNPMEDSDVISVHGTGTDDLYWYIKNSLDHSETDWGFGVELRVSLEGEIVLQQWVWRYPGSQQPKEDYGVIYNVGDLFGYDVELLFDHIGNIFPTSGAGYGSITYPY